MSVRYEETEQRARAAGANGRTLRDACGATAPVRAGIEHGGRPDAPQGHGGCHGAPQGSGGAQDVRQRPEDARGHEDARDHEDAAIRAMVDAWPPLSAGQRDRLAVLLRPGRLPCDSE